MADDGAGDATIAHLVDRHGELGQPLDGQVGADRVPDRADETRQLPEDAPAIRRGVLQRDDDLLLPPRPREVALAGRLAAARIGQRVDAVEVMMALRDRPPASIGAEAVIARIVDRLGHGDVDAADRVDHLDEAFELHGRVVVDRDAEQFADSAL